MGDKYTIDIPTKYFETAVMIQTNHMLENLEFNNETTVFSFREASPELAEITKLDLKKSEITVKFLGGEEKVYPIVKIENYGVVKSDA